MTLTANGRRQKWNFLAFVLSRLYGKVITFAFNVNKKFFPIFLLDWFKEYSENEQNQNYFLPFAVAVNVMLKLTIIGSRCLCSVTVPRACTQNLRFARTTCCLLHLMYSEGKRNKKLQRLQASELLVYPKCVAGFCHSETQPGEVVSLYIVAT